LRYHETTVKVRFNEIDSYHVAWHGHYVGWMEIGRNGLAGEFGLNADEIAALGYMAPVVTLELSFKKPARFNDLLTVRTSAARTPTATLHFVCSIRDSSGAVYAEGRTVHVLTDLEGTLQYRLPPEIGARLDKMMEYLEG
jgi:acyl-CoA thioester hydrolase